MSVRNISLLITTIFVSVSCFAVNPLKPIITRQAAKGVEYTPREIVKNAKFQRPVVPVSSTRIHSLPSFDAKTALLSGEQALDFVVSRHSTSLYEELLDNLKSFEEADLSFSGSFVPSLQALREETQQYARKEFTTSPEQALQAMLDELPNSTEGYAIIKVAQRVPEEAEPRQTILVMDPQNLSWTVFTQTVQSTVVQAVLLDKFVPLLDEEGKEYLFVALEDTGSGKGIIVYNPSDIDNIRDAYASSDVNSYGQRIPREHPFYVRVVAFGNAVSPGLNVDPRITSVYPTYKLEYGATAHGPFFSTVSEVEAYLSMKEEPKEIFSQQSSSAGMPSGPTISAYSRAEDVNGPFFDTLEELEAWKAGQANSEKKPIPPLNLDEKPLSPVVLDPDPNAPFVKSHEPKIREREWDINFVPAPPSHMPEPERINPHAGKTSISVLPAHTEKGVSDKRPLVRKYPTPMEDSTNMPDVSAVSATQSTSSEPVKVVEEGYPPSYQSRNMPGTYGVHSTLVDRPISPVVLDPEPPAAKRWSGLDDQGYPVSFRSISTPGMPWAKKRGDGELDPDRNAPLPETPEEGTQQKDWTAGEAPIVPVPAEPHQYIFKKD